MPVYFIRAAESGHVKIGWSAKVCERLETLQIATFERLEVIGQIPGALGTEQAIHRLLARHRLGPNEWFRGCPELQDRISCILSNPVGFSALSFAPSCRVNLIKDRRLIWKRFGTPRFQFKKKREALGLTRYAVSVGIGMDPSYWKHFEEGRCTPSVPVAKKIAEFLTQQGQPTTWQEVVDETLDEATPTFPAAVGV